MMIKDLKSSLELLNVLSFFSNEPDLNNICTLVPQITGGPLYTEAHRLLETVSIKGNIIYRTRVINKRLVLY